MTDTLRISNQNLLQYQSSVNISSIDSELCDSRNTECDIEVSLNNLSLMNTVHEEATEVIMLSNISLMDTSYNIPMCFTTDESQNNHVDFDKQLYSNNSTESENIFIECSRLFVHNYTWPKRKRFEFDKMRLDSKLRLEFETRLSSKSSFKDRTRSNSSIGTSNPIEFGLPIFELDRT